MRLKNMLARIRPLAFCVAAIGVLSGCAETELASHIAKKGRGHSQGTFKVGDPYKVGGQWYNPTETYEYTQTGIASWYGPQFHGKRTANGEIFNMNELTAAHKTLQMPSLVRVTNLENGRSIIVRINDRGPFSRGRVIDMSSKAADLLNFKAKGTAKVRIQVLSEESRAIAMAARQGKSTKGYEVAMNQQGRLPEPPAAELASADINTSVPGHIRDGRFYPDPVVSHLPVTPSNIFVQAGSFSDQGNASRLADRLKSFGPARVSTAVVGGRNFYRVRFGPVKNVEQADKLLSRLGNAGYGDAMTIVD
jgi:rare lipoprotein A